MSDANDFADQLELFFGEAANAVAYFYARLRGIEPESRLQLTGTLTGPSCLYAKTLKATFSFADRGPGKSLLAEAIVPEPCFWTPEMPHLYQADVQLRRDGEILARTARMVGIRLLGAQGRKLIYGGKRWVLRAVSRGEVPPTEIGQWRGCDAAMLVRNPDENLCQEASRVGVLLVAELNSPSPTADSKTLSPRARASSSPLSPRGRGHGEGAVLEWPLNEIRRLSRWPAVGMVVLPSRAALDLDGLAHNLLLAERFGPDQPIEPSVWADVAVCEVADPDHLAARIADCKLPIIAARAVANATSVAEARAGCDRLQRDLAGQCEISGYIV
ncbi:MAG: hypothetical protein HY288_15805 [Planctomycetia bacterium]|nr:hypothetical protein [Planctomycetia bacterium]